MNEQGQKRSGPPNQEFDPSQGDGPTVFYEWFARIDGKLQSHLDKIHSIDKEVSIVRDRTNDLPEIRKTLAQVETKVCELPEIKSDIKDITKKIWMASGIISVVVIIVQLLAAGLVAYLVRSNTIPVTVTPSLSTPYTLQSSPASPEIRPQSGLPYRPDNSPQ